VASIRPNCGGRLTLVLAALPQSHTLSDILISSQVAIPASENGQPRSYFSADATLGPTHWR
jgi:hypothetical protein